MKSSRVEKAATLVGKLADQPVGLGRVHVPRLAPAFLDAGPYGPGVYPLGLFEKERKLAAGLLQATGKPCALECGWLSGRRRKAFRTALAVSLRGRWIVEAGHAAHRKWDWGTGHFAFDLECSLHSSLEPEIRQVYGSNQDSLGKQLSKNVDSDRQTAFGGAFLFSENGLFASYAKAPKWWDHISGGIVDVARTSCTIVRLIVTR